MKLHVNDRMLYFGGHRHRQGTDVEAYAQGMLQTPSSIGHQGEYGARFEHGLSS